MPDANDPNRSGDQADIQPMSPFTKAYVDQQIRDAIKQYDESQTKTKKWRNSWRSASPIAKAGIYLSGFAAAATIVLAFFAWQQLDAMKKIAVSNTEQTRQLIDAANQMKAAGWIFSGASIGTNNAAWGAVGKLQLQADQVKRSVAIANKSLHISQRAYISHGATIDWAKTVISFTIENKGRVPSGPVHLVLLISKTVKTPDGEMNTTNAWIERRVDRLAIGVPESFGGTTFEADRFKSGEEWFHFGLIIEYNDGFPPKTAIDVEQDALCTDYAKATGPTVLRFQYPGNAEKIHPISKSQVSNNSLTSPSAFKTF